MNNKQFTGNIGLYYVCYRLSKLNWNVAPTARNAVGVDIIAYNEDSTRKITIQVKALSGPETLRFGGKTISLADYWVIVNQARTESPNCYILLPKEIEDLATKAKTTGNMYWITPKNYDTPEYHEQWERIK